MKKLDRVSEILSGRVSQGPLWVCGYASSPEPDAYPDERDGLGETRRYSRAWYRYRFLVALIVLLLVMAGGIGYLANSREPGTTFYIFSHVFLTFTVLLLLSIVGILIFLMLCDYSVGEIFAPPSLAQKNGRRTGGEEELREEPAGLPPLSLAELTRRLKGLEIRVGKL